MGWICGCSTPTEEVVVPLSQQIREDQSYFASLKSEVSKGDLRDSQLENYLQKLARSLVDEKSPFKGHNWEIVIKKANPGATALLGSLPYGTLYFSTELWKKLATENELAALIAIELARLELRQQHQVALRNAFKNPLAVEYQSGELKAAVNRALELMYHAKYDPRGLAVYWERNHSRELQQVSSQELYEMVSKNVPIRNPIVNSDTFQKVLGTVLKNGTS